jgi:hypothetical protein
VGFAFQAHVLSGGFFSGGWDAEGATLRLLDCVTGQIVTRGESMEVSRVHGSHNDQRSFLVVSFGDVDNLHAWRRRTERPNLGALRGHAPAERDGDESSNQEKDEQSAHRVHRARLEREECPGAAGLLLRARDDHSWISRVVVRAVAMVVRFGGVVAVGTVTVVRPARPVAVMRVIAVVRFGGMVAAVGVRVVAVMGTVSVMRRAGPVAVMCVVAVMRLDGMVAMMWFASVVAVVRVIAMVGTVTVMRWVRPVAVMRVVAVMRRARPVAVVCVIAVVCAVAMVRTGVVAVMRMHQQERGAAGVVSGGGDAQRHEHDSGNGKGDAEHDLTNGARKWWPL